MNRIVAGLDFSNESEMALGHAIQLARRTGARLVLTHVLPLAADLAAEPSYDPLFRAGTMSAEVMAQQRGDAAGLLGQWMERCRQAGVASEPLLIDDNPSDGLARAAEETGADLVVVGSHGRTGLKRFLLGSVAERTIRLSPCHTLVARGQVHAERGYHRIAVASDFSPHAEAALRAAMAVAADDARIEVVHCWTTPVMPAGLPVTSIRGDIERDVATSGARLLERFSAELPRLAFVPIEATPAEGLRARAEETGCELIVIGSHGRRGVRRWLLGSIAETTVRHAPCSVLVVRGDAAAAKTANIAA